MLSGQLAISWQRLKDWWNGLGWDLSPREDVLGLLDPDPDSGGEELNPRTGYPMLDEIIDVHGNTYGSEDHSLCDDD